MDIILKATGLKKYYSHGNILIKVLDGIDLELKRGEFTAITGTSGSGKSTLLNILGGLDIPSEGSVKVSGTELYGLNREEAITFRRRQIGFIFQNYNLIPTLNVWENILFPLSMDSQQPDLPFLSEVISLLGLGKKLYCLPNSLSEGQQQRVAIARAVVKKPSILLADEPTGNLDSKISDDIIGLLKLTCKESNQTIAMITHHSEIAQIADRVVQIEDGKIGA